MQNTISIPEDIGDYVSYDPESGVLCWVRRPYGPSGRPCNRVPLGRPIERVDPSTGYIRFGFGRRMLYAHRVAWFLAAGGQPEQIDHRNGDKTDNRLRNLRAASARENRFNSSLRSNNSSGYVGVSWSRAHSKWYAYIRADGRTKSLGLYDTLDAAVRARHDGEKILHGDFGQHARSSPENEEV